jgi:HprK-related kinase A
LIVADLPSQALAERLAGPGLRLRTGPVVTEIRSRMPAIVEGIALLYAEHPADEADAFADFHVSLDPHRWWKPQVIFRFDDSLPFHPLPADQAFPMLEWGLNWCISAHCHQYLLVHAAVVERFGRALALPGPPGSGKSTLCAGLVSRGWRLLSDELMLLDRQSRMIVPLPRPISLKNQSIEVIRQFAPHAVLGPRVRDTLKGSVAHLKPPVESIRASGERASPGWVVFPRYEPGASLALKRLRKGPAFMRLADCTFNYHLHGRQGFEILADLVEACACYEIAYGDLEDAVTAFAKLAAGA